MCGPDVDVVEEVHVRRSDDANFIHGEIYKDQTGSTFAGSDSINPSLKAR